MEKNLSNLNEIMGRKTNLTPSFIKSDGLFIRKPFDVANYFNDYLFGKVGKLRQEMPMKKQRAIIFMHKKTNNEREAEVEKIIVNDQ